MYCAGCLSSDNKTRQDEVGENAALSRVINSERSAEPQPEIGDHDTTGDAETATTCDWPLNVTWIFQHYNNVSETQRTILA